MKEVAVKGHAHGTATVWYRRVAVWGHEWKFAGVCPHIRWSEFDYDKVFEQGKEQLGDGEEGGGGEREVGGVEGEEFKKAEGKDHLRDGEGEGGADVVDGKQIQAEKMEYLRDGDAETKANVVDGKQTQAEEKDHLEDGEGQEKGGVDGMNGHEDLPGRPKDFLGNGEKEDGVDGVNGHEDPAA